MEVIHNAGFVHNDIKPDNIMIQNNETTIIDFGFSRSYLEDGIHIENEDVEKFQGNVFFASHNRMQFKSASRRDDLISLVYLLVYLLNRGNFLDLDASIYDFNHVKETKGMQTLESLCSGKAACLTDFANGVFSLEFKQTPDYRALSALMAKHR